MTYDQFLGQVQHRARLASRGEAERVSQAVLETLGARLAGGEPKDLASQLPPELGRYLLGPTAGMAARLQTGDIYALVSDLEGVDIPTAAHHVRAVASVLREAVSPGEWRDVLAQLPPELDRLLDSGSDGEAPSV